MNTEITAREVRLISSASEQLGVLPIQEALRLAGEQNVDLVEVSPQASPPVCRLMDYGRFKYEQHKKDREAKHKRRNLELKEVKFRPKIDEHDFQTKARLVRRLLDGGDKVKVTLMFRGREVIYTTLGEQLMARVAAEAGETVIIERRPRLEGKAMIMILAPKPAG